MLTDINIYVYIYIICTCIYVLYIYKNIDIKTNSNICTIQIYLFTLGSQFLRVLLFTTQVLKGLALQAGFPGEGLCFRVQLNLPQRIYI